MISELILTVFASVSLATKNNSMSASHNTPEKENAFSLVHDVATDGNTVLTGDDLRQYNIKHSQKSGSGSGIDDAESYLKSCFGNDCFIVKDEANSDMLENSPESPNEFTTPYMATVDRKSTRLNSSHQINSYAVFCLKKKIILKDLVLLLSDAELPLTDSRRLSKI